MKRAFVRVPEAAERGKVVFAEVLAVVGEGEAPVRDADRGFGRLGVIRVLQQLGEYVARALNLPEQLMPRARELGITLELVPTSSRGIADALEVGGRLHHCGTVARAIRSAKS